MRFTASGNKNKSQKAMKKIHVMLSRRNRLYSKLLRENITNRDILSVHALLVALYLGCLAMETLLS